MTSKKKKQSIADKTLREDPTLNSAPPDAARSHEGHYKRFSVGDMVVEDLNYSETGSERFGIILEIHRFNTFSVRFVDGVDYSHASFCQPYGDWLREAKKKI